MNCSYCGYFNEHETEICARCGTQIPPSTCPQCDRDMAWGEEHCDSCGPIKENDSTPCPSCSTFNARGDEYCTQCGTPMAVITRVHTRKRDEGPLDTWRVYGIETSIVGRQEELEILESIFQEVVEHNEVRFVALTSPTGRGKSRLLAEFKERLNSQLSEAHVSHAASRDDAGDPYSMFARLLKNRFYIDKNETPTKARRKLLDATKYLIGGPESDRIAHLVGELLDIHFEDSPYLPSVRDTEGAIELDRRCFEALTELLVADASKDPLVIILEDLQYATPRSLDLISHVMKHLSSSRILFILTWVPEELKTAHFFSSTTFHQTIELDLLSDEEVESFVRDTLRKVPEIPQHVLSKIVAASHGDPLAVEETLRILISQGIVDTRTKDWTVDLERFEEVVLPKTLKSAVHARLNTLTQDERIVLEMAACVGNVFWTELVRCSYRLHTDSSSHQSAQWGEEDSEDERCNAILESLERKDIIRRHEDAIIPHTREMFFKHRLEQQMIYEDIAPEQKKRFHALNAQWLESKSMRMVDVIATHFERAGVLDHAGLKFLEAAKLARKRYQNERALGFYLKSLRYLGDAGIDKKITALGELGTIYMTQGEYDQALPYFREMLRYCWLLNDQIRGGDAYINLALSYQYLGEYDTAMTNLGNALHLFHETDEKIGIAKTLDAIGAIHAMRGDFNDSSDRYEAALQLRREIGDKRAIAESLNSLGALRLQQGDLKAAMGHFRNALDYRKEIDDRQGVVASYNNLAVLCVERNQIEQALHLLREALSIAREIGYRGSESVVLNNIGEVYLISNQVAQSLVYLKEAKELSELSGEKRVLFDVCRNLGKLALREKKNELALEKMTEALSVANQLDSQLLVGIGMGNLADAHAQLYLDSEDPRHRNLAETFYSDSLDILQTIGNETELGRLLLNHARLLFEQKEFEKTLVSLRSAKAIFERIDFKDELATTIALIQKVENK